MRSEIRDRRKYNELKESPATANLRVALATSGRFHLLDLAREMDALSVQAKFYSYVSRRRARKFGLPSRCHVALLPVLFPLVAWERLFPKVFPSLVERLMCWGQDVLVILRMRKCDVFGCMSGMYLLAPRFAKMRYGAKIVVYRASSHAFVQKELLSQNPQGQQISSFMIKRELKGYEIADVIDVPSKHVVKSFAAWPEHARKVVQNPYGVDIDQFPLNDRSNLPTAPTVIFVGHWSYRKGVDILVNAMEEMANARLIHVGAILDLPFPRNKRFTHFDSVPQWKLRDFYAMAHVFVLASREDGFGYVLAQALASGLPIVCTDRTGGVDLANFPGLARLIHLVPVGDATALRAALDKALGQAMGGYPFTPITEAERQLLSWRSYALRELQVMRKLMPPARDETAPQTTHQTARV